MSISVFALPIRSPTAPKMRPPVAQPATKIVVAYPPKSFKSCPPVSRDFIAEPRASRKSCWSKQSKSHARQAIAKTNQ